MAVGGGAWVVPGCRHGGQVGVGLCEVAGCFAGRRDVGGMSCG